MDFFCRGLMLFMFVLVSCHPSESVDDPREALESEVEPTDGAGSEAAGDTSEDPGESGDEAESAPEPDPVPLEGFGVITGACGMIDAMVRAQAEPLMIQNDIDFADDPYDESDFDLLSEGGREIIADGNAGGSSLYSEVFAFEVLTRCEGAELMKTETEILYDDPQGKKTDLLVTLDGEQLGVSVTRAVGFPREDPYTVERAQALLEQKLEGIVASTLNVNEGDSWNKQILHVLAYEPAHADSLAEAFTMVDPALTTNTIVVVTVSSGDDAFLY